MTVAAASDLHKAVAALWVSTGLNASFNQYWEVANRTVFTVLNDGQAAPQQPTPYCVFEQSAGSTTARMSGVGTINQEIRDIPWKFRIHAQLIDGDLRTAKEIAADLAELVLKVFGGHPDTPPQDLTLTNGNFLITQYQSDFGLRTDDDSHQWTIDYLFRLDVPVAT